MYRNVLDPRTMFNSLFLALITLAKLMILGMTILIGITVFMRYVMGIGVRWSAELALVLQVWFTFIAMALGVRKQLHISINIMPEHLSPRLNWVLLKLRAVVVGGVGLTLLVYGIDLVESTMRSVLPAMGLRSGYLYLAVPVGGTLILLESIVDLLGIDRKDEWLEPYIGEDEAIAEEDIEQTQSELIERQKSGGNAEGGTP
ncbi:MAG: TRAP transporter small permease [Spirochaetota bacterium]